MNIAFVAALICFLIAALAPLFDWALGDFNALAWGLAALTVALGWPAAAARRT